MTKDQRTVHFPDASGIIYLAPVSDELDQRTVHFPDASGIIYLAPVSDELQQLEKAFDDWAKDSYKTKDVIMPSFQIQEKQFYLYASKLGWFLIDNFSYSNGEIHGVLTNPCHVLPCREIPALLRTTDGVYNCKFSLINSVTYTISTTQLYEYYFEIIAIHPM